MSKNQNNNSDDPFLLALEKAKTPQEIYDAVMMLPDPPQKFIDENRIQWGDLTSDTPTDATENGSSKD